MQYSAKEQKKTRKKKYGKELLRENAELYVLLLPVLIIIFIFSYIPIYGLVTAFQNYSPGAPFLAFDGNTEWVGLYHFKRFISGPYFGRLMKNTLVLSLLNLVFGFWIPIVFALVLNEIHKLRFKKFVQTASYLPYFISWVVVAGMVLSFVSREGVITKFLTLFGLPATDYATSPRAFPVIYTITNIWKSFGFNSILYISAMAGIDPALYESARIDGATRMEQIWYITLPSIMPTIAIMLIMAVGSIMNSNTDLILLLYKPSTYPTADVIGSYIYRTGILGGELSYTSAVGVFTSVINFILLFTANQASKKLTETSMF